MSRPLPISKLFRRELGSRYIIDKTTYNICWPHRKPCNHPARACPFIRKHRSPTVNYSKLISFTNLGNREPLIIPGRRFKRTVDIVDWGGQAPFAPNFLSLDIRIKPTWKRLHVPTKDGTFEWNQMVYEGNLKAWVYRAESIVDEGYLFVHLHSRPVVNDLV